MQDTAKDGNAMVNDVPQKWEKIVYLFHHQTPLLCDCWIYLNCNVVKPLFHCNSNLKLKSKWNYKSAHLKRRQSLKFWILLISVCGKHLGAQGCFTNSCVDKNRDFLVNNWREKQKRSTAWLRLSSFCRLKLYSQQRLKSLLFQNLTF